MKKEMLLLPVCAMLLGCFPEGVTANKKKPGGPGGPPEPPPPPTVRVGYYASPTGASTGDGSIERPWDLATALRHPASVHPGDTIWMRAGTYQGNFVSTLTGTASAPVVLRQFPGERATIDGRLDVNGSHAYYWGFEVTYSNPVRVTQQSGSDPTDMPRERITVFVIGPFNKLINLVVHDLGDGIFAGSPAEGLEINGVLLYNNGWNAPDRGHGHSLYLQNKGATKRIVDNVMFNSFSTGLKVGGSGAAYMLHFDIIGNTSFASGGPTAADHGYQFNTHLEGGGGNLGYVTYSRNSFFHIDGTQYAFRMNAAGDPPGQSLTFTDNIVQGQAQFHEWNGYVIQRNKFTSGLNLLSGQAALLGFRTAAGVPLTANVWDRNMYSAPAESPRKPFYMVDNGVGSLYTLDEWKARTGYDVSSSYGPGAFQTPDIIVRPSSFEPGRAFVTCWNWQGAPSLNVDLSAVLRPGDRYTVHHVYDVFGSPVVSGTYDGAPVAIPQTDRTPPRPLGYSITPASTGVRFNVFLVRRS